MNDEYVPVRPESTKNEAVEFRRAFDEYIALTGIRVELPVRNKYLEHFRKENLLKVGTIGFQHAFIHSPGRFPSIADICKWGGAPIAEDRSAEIAAKVWSVSLNPLDFGPKEVREHVGRRLTKPTSEVIKLILDHELGSLGHDVLSRFGGAANLKSASEKNPLSAKKSLKGIVELVLSDSPNHKDLHRFSPGFKTKLVIPKELLESLAGPTESDTNSIRSNVNISNDSQHDPSRLTVDFREFGVTPKRLQNE